ncbi:hypothetical protein BH23GEM9_BH23GEM9_32590 [soil metagenome]
MIQLSESTGQRSDEPSADSVFAGGGELGMLCREFDWADTPLGPVEDWSHSLRTTVSIVLNSRHPMFLWWGPDLVQIYNDGYRPSLGYAGRHPGALGACARDFWTDIWDIIGPQIDGVMTRGESTWHENQLVAIERNGRTEEVYWTYGYSPARDDDGTIGGCLVVCQENTQQVIAQRRLATLHRLAALEPQTTPQQAAAQATRVLAGDSYDVPFALCYFRDGGADDARSVLVHGEGLTTDVATDFWPLDAVISSGTTLIVDLKGRPEFDGVGPWPEAPESAVVIPIRAGGDRRVGALVVGLSARLPWGDEYQEFLGAAANHVATQIAAGERQQERERRDRELEVERSRLAFVFRNAPAFLAVLRGPQHVFELVNDEYYQLVGARDLVGKPLFEALPDVRDQGFEALLDGVLATGRPFIGHEVPLLIAREPGAPPQERFLDFVYMPLIEADGTRSGVIAHGTDVTAYVHARREVERLLHESEEARAQAEDANRTKSQFLATMSHEIRTPLNAILGYADLLETGLRGTLTEGQQLFVDRIKMSSDHLVGLIDDILDLSKIEAGGMTVNRDAVPVHEVVREALAMIIPQARKKGLQVSDEFQCEVADSAYHGDRGRVRQILGNLLSNAVKFTKPGASVSVRCLLRETATEEAQVHGAGPWIAIEVEDSGIGIADSYIPRIFEPFVQVDAGYTRKSGGTGLGLTISRKLARLMGGDLTVRSRAGDGSCFTLWLDTIPAAAETPQGSSHQ